MTSDIAVIAIAPVAFFPRTEMDAHSPLAALLILLLLDIPILHTYMDDPVALPSRVGSCLKRRQCADRPCTTPPEVTTMPVRYLLCAILLTLMVVLMGCPKAQETSPTDTDPATSSPATSAKAPPSSGGEEMATCPVLGITMPKRKMIPLE